MSEPYKDKIEVSLDSRQVFYLFFGGAIVMCLVFVLGVMVGKRVEARAHLDRPAISAARDPLAALDRLATDGPNELSFRQALTGGSTPAGEVERQIARLEKLRTTANQPASRGKPAELAPKVASDTEPVAKPDHKTAPPPEKEPRPASEPRPAASASAPRPATSPSDVAPADTEPKKGRFTLQLSAFRERAEADAFLAEVKAAGFAAYVTEAHVEDKGTFFRVRLGSYPSYDAAVVAKTDFERKLNKIAYVSRI